MPDPDLRLDLGRLADDGGRAAHLATALDVRRRADGRRTRRRVAGAALGVVAVASIGVATQYSRGGDDADDPAVPPSSSAGPLAEPTNRRQFSPSRQVALLPVGTSTVVTVGGDGTGTDAQPGDPVVAGTTLDDRALLVGYDVGEDSGFYTLETGAVTADGQPLCLSVAGPEPTVERCDGAGAGQVFRVRPRGKVDGFQTYSLVELDGERLDVGGTVFHVVDRGKATLPGFE